MVEVQPSDNPPVQYEGRPWVRVGPRRAIASPEEVRRLTEKRRWGNLPFDAQGAPDAKIDDIDLQRFSSELLPALVPADILAQNNRTQAQQLTALRLLRPDETPTISALLLIGRNPQALVPGAYVQFLRIDGTNLTDPILDQQQITGTLPDQILRLDSLAAINIRRATTVGGSTRSEQADYPIEAIRQIVRNALLHRNYDGTNAPVRITWYANRIEIQSPGGPFPAEIDIDEDERCLAQLKDYRSLMPMAQEARRPMFLLRPADGAIGGHQGAVRTCYEDFSLLADKIAERIDLPAIS